MPENPDAEAVRKCLTAWLVFGRGLLCPSLVVRCQETEEALEALERIAQPRVERWVPRDEEGGGS